VSGVRTFLVAACLATLAVATTASAVAAASTSLVEVQPGNGATVRQVPADAVLTFSTPLDPARVTATVTAPGQQAREAHVQVDGARLAVALPSAGQGDYVIGYSVAGAPGEQGQASAGDRVTGEVGFSVSSTATSSSESAGTAPWAFMAGLGVLGLVGALLVTARRWWGVR
jgi:methionine-rich copper-binding protein CopC